MRWKLSEVLLRKFKEKYEPVFEALGWKTEVSERIVGGTERHLVIAIFRDGHITARHLTIHEVAAPDSRWIRVASTYNSTGVVKKVLNEEVWKSFYSQLNKIVSSCVLDMLHEVGVNGTVRFSLRDGLEVKMPNTEVKIPTDQINEISRIIALSNL